MSPVDLLSCYSKHLGEAVVRCYQEHLGEAKFRDSYLLASTQAHIFLCISLYFTENEIQSIQNIFIRVNNEHINIIQIIISIRINN